MISKAFTMISLLTSIISGSSFIDYSILKIPEAVSIDNAVCSGDYIWYTFKYDNRKESSSSERPVQVGKLHIPTKQHQIFDVRYDDYETTQIAAVDSSHVAIFQSDSRHNKLVHYYNGSNWKIFTNVLPFLKKILALPSGKIMLLSVDNIGFIENDTIRTISHSDLGFDQYLVDIGRDNKGKVWIISKDQIVSYYDAVWKKELSCDSTYVLKEVFTNIDGAVSFVTNKGLRILDNGVLRELPVLGEKCSERCAKDQSGRVWKINNTNNSYFTHSIQMSYDSTVINSYNAENNGWENWPVLFESNDEKYSITTNKNRVVIKYRNGFYHYAGNDKKVWEWLPLPEILDSKEVIHDITVSPDSTVYLKVRYGSLYKYNSGTFESLPYSSYSLSVFVDHQSTLWLNGTAQLYKWQDPFFCPVSFEIITGIDNVFEDNTNRMIILSGNSIIRKDGSTWEIVNESNSNIPSLPRDNTTLLQTKDGTFWIKTSTASTLNSTNLDSLFRSDNLYNWEYVDVNTIPPGGINELYVTSRGNLIVIENGGGPVFKYDGAQWINLGAPNVIDTLGESNAKTIICEDNNGKIWYGRNLISKSIISVYNDTGWCILDSSLNFYDGIGFGNVNDIACDPFNQIWVATGKEVRIYNSQTQNIGSKFYSKHTNSAVLSVRCSGHKKTSIEYTIDTPSDITLSLYSLSGQKLQTLKKGFHRKGTYQFFVQNSIAKGNYILRLTTPETSYSVNYMHF